MRVISGEFGGRRLEAVAGDRTRPTADKVKESMFNMIGPYFSGGQALDLYAGTGALGIEAVSRGMDHATLVDRQFAAIKTMQRNVAMLRAEDQFTIVKSSVAHALERFAEDGRVFDLILADPPYAQQEVMKQLAFIRERGLLSAGGRVLIETGLDVDYPSEIPGFVQLRRQKYGVAQVLIVALNSDIEGDS